MNENDILKLFILYLEKHSTLNEGERKVFQSYFEYLLKPTVVLGE